MTKRFSLILFLALPFVLGLCCLLGGDDPRRADDKAPRYEPTDRYETREIEGWTVLVHKNFGADEPELLAKTLKHLGHHLHQIVHKLPESAVGPLREVRIWVEENEPHHPCMAYHPDPDWLREHDMNPDKARCVEMSNARNFLRWTREQPWMVLHELAHAYHHQFLDEGFSNPEVRQAFEKAKKQGLYDSVLHFDGKEVKAYAAGNPMEYFAEATEAYFGTNDFFPFVRAELKRHDPALHDLLGRLWNRAD